MLVISAFDKEIQNKTHQKEKNRSRLASVSLLTKYVFKTAIGNLNKSDNQKAPSRREPQITDKGFRTTVLSLLSYFTGFEKYGII